MEEFLVYQTHHSCIDDDYNDDDDNTVDDIQKKMLLHQQKEVMEDRRHDNTPVGKIDLEKNYEPKESSFKLIFELSVGK